MGESTNPRATLRFDRRLRLEFRGATMLDGRMETHRPLTE